MDVKLRVSRIRLWNYILFVICELKKEKFNGGEKILMDGPKDCISQFDDHEPVMFNGNLTH